MVILALGAALALVLATALFAWRSHVHRRRRFTRAVQELDESLAGLGENLRRALESATTPREAPKWAPPLDPEAGEPLVAHAARAAPQTDVEAAALRVSDAGDSVAVALLESGPRDGDTSPEGP